MADLLDREGSEDNMELCDKEEMDQEGGCGLYITMVTLKLHESHDLDILPVLDQTPGNVMLDTGNKTFRVELSYLLDSYMYIICTYNLR